VFIAVFLIINVEPGMAPPLSVPKYLSPRLLYRFVTSC